MGESEILKRIDRLIEQVEETKCKGPARTVMLDILNELNWLKESVEEERSLKREKPGPKTNGRRGAEQGVAGVEPAGETPATLEAARELQQTGEEAHA